MYSPMVKWVRSSKNLPYLSSWVSGSNQKPMKLKYYLKIAWFIKHLWMVLIVDFSLKQKPRTLLIDSLFFHIKQDANRVKDGGLTSLRARSWSWEATYTGKELGGLWGKAGSPWDVQGSLKHIRHICMPPPTSSNIPEPLSITGVVLVIFGTWVNLYPQCCILMHDHWTFRVDWVRMSGVPRLPEHAWELPNPHHILQKRKK